MVKNSVVEKIHEVFKSKSLRLSVAESCTAGLISHIITSSPGASLFFDSGVVAYSAESKKKLLGLSMSLIKKHGIVSEETARAMAEAIRGKTGTDFALATTGNLGPNGHEGSEAAVVYVAVAFGKGTTSRGYSFKGSREEVKLQAAVSALELLYEAVSLWP